MKLVLPSGFFLLLFFLFSSAIAAASVGGREDADGQAPFRGGWQLEEVSGGVKKESEDASAAVGTVANSSREGRNLALATGRESMKVATKF